jgi:hypothetical protein
MCQIYTIPISKKERKKYTLNVTRGEAYLLKELQGALFPAVISTAVKFFSSQFSNSIIGP